MDTEAAKVHAPAAAGKVHPILKKGEDAHHKGSSAACAPAASAPAAAAGDGKTQSEGGNSQSSPGKEKKHLKWDENAIEEHNLLRGTRMKIDEPNTPYTHYDHHSDEESHSSGHHPRSPDETHPEHGGASLATQWGDLSGKLQAVADKRDACPHSPAPSRDSNMSDSEDERKRKEHDRKFRDLRKKHYNEAEMMRRWRAEHADDEDEDDEDEEDGNKDKMEE